MKIRLLCGAGEIKRPSIKSKIPLNKKAGEEADLEKEKSGFDRDKLIILSKPTKKDETCCFLVRRVTVKHVNELGR